MSVKHVLRIRPHLHMKCLHLLIDQQGLCADTFEGALESWVDSTLRSMATVVKT